MTSTTRLRLQEPGGQGDHLLEAMLEECTGATGGGAIFAWTNAAGATAFLQHDNFNAFVESAPFDLVVGVDSITDEAAVKTLIGMADNCPLLSVRVFVHGTSAMFHPKLAWFRTLTGFTLLVGSGNLTIGGLKGNWEAFAAVALTGAQARQAETVISEWLDTWDANLLAIDDPAVLARAKKNTGNERSLKRSSREPVTKAADEVGASMLVAEIPKGGNRWSQANFDLENYETFFGAKVGTHRSILLYEVTPVGGLGHVESRPSVEVKSQNYRFELAAAKGLTYPKSGRPIGVFLRLGTGEFLYMLLMPGTGDHAAVDAFLKAQWKGSAGRMRRVRTTVAALRTAWPHSPLWRARLPKL